MPSISIKAVEDLVAEHNALRAKEGALITGLRTALAHLGYDIVPRSADHRPGAQTPAPPARRPRGSPSEKVISCPHCSRTFARPLHLGRHMKAAHKAAAASGQEAAATATGVDAAEENTPASVEKKPRHVSRAAGKAAPPSTKASSRKRRTMTRAKRKGSTPTGRTAKK